MEQATLTPFEVEKELTLDAASYQHDPAGYVKAFFPWGTGELEGEAGAPRETQIAAAQSPET